MKIKPEISSVTSTLTTTSGNKIPIVDTSEAETTVMVKDNTTIIIAGLRRDEYIQSDERIPYLGDMPFLGRLFQSGSKEKKRIEAIVFLTPHITGGEKFITGDSPHPTEGMKEYAGYSPLTLKSERKSDSSSGAVSSLFKKLPFVGHD